MPVRNVTVDSPYFWTDVDQAQARLLGTLILYDGLPYWVREIRDGYSDGIPRAVLASPLEGSTIRRRLDSPKFERFRRLPPLGFVNCVQNNTLKAVFLRRRARNHQRHGLTSEVVRVYTPPFGSDGSDRPSTGFLRFDNVTSSEGYMDACKGEFPTLEEILQRGTPNSCLAYSPKYAVYRDPEGLRWLFRETEKVGLFTGTDTLNLFPTTKFWREEIMEDPLFTCNFIQEF